MNSDRPQCPNIMVRLLALGLFIICMNGCARLISDLVIMPLKITEQVAVGTARVSFQAAELTARLAVDAADSGVHAVADLGNGD